MSWRSIPLSGTAEEEALIDQTARFILCYLSPFLFVVLYAVVPSPYGKLITPTWQRIMGPALPAPLAWFLFELPNLAWAGIVVARHLVSAKSLDNTSQSPCNYLLVAFFVIHYFRRTIWYPLQMSSRAKAVPLGVVVNALAYTSVNG
jgi:steroid 5-alpha-reductase